MAPLAPEHLPEELQRFPELIRVQGARLTLPLFRVLARGDAESLVELQLCWADGTKTRHTLRRPRPKPLLQDDIDLADERITKVRFDGDKSKSRLHRLASLERTGTHAILRWKTMSLKSTGSDRSQLSNHVIRLLEGVAPTDGLIIDLRVNHGGQLHVALDVLAHFLTSEIKIVGPHEKLDYLGGLISLSLFGTWPVKPREPRFTFPVVVLTSWQTGSAAELFARLMQKEQGATLVGERTIGAEAGLSSVEGADGSSLSFGKTRFIEKIGIGHQEVGIIPDVSVRLRVEDLRRFGSYQTAYSDWDKRIHEAAIRTLEQKLETVNP